MNTQPMQPRFWIQDIAPNGGYFDSIGLPESATLDEARKQLEGWRKAFPAKKSRLIIRQDAVLIA